MTVAHPWKLLLPNECCKCDFKDHSNFQLILLLLDAEECDKTIEFHENEVCHLTSLGIKYIRCQINAVEFQNCGKGIM